LIQMMSVQGPLAREVRDVRLALEAMARRDPHDPWWVPAPLEGRRPKPPVRVALTKSSFGFPIHPSVARAVADAGRILEEAGYDVSEVDPPSIIEASELWRNLLLTEVKTLQDADACRLASPEMQRYMDDLYATAKLLDLEGYMSGLAARARMLREWSLFLEKCPILVCPLSLDPPWRPDFDLEGRKNVERVFDALCYAGSMNLLGLPAAFVPTGLDAGTPRGVQIVGQRYREDMVLDAAEAIERKAGILAPRLWER